MSLPPKTDEGRAKHERTLKELKNCRENHSLLQKYLSRHPRARFVVVRQEGGFRSATILGFAYILDTSHTIRSLQAVVVSKEEFMQGVVPINLHSRTAMSLNHLKQQLGARTSNSYEHFLYQCRKDMWIPLFVLLTNEVRSGKSKVDFMLLPQLDDSSVPLSVTFVLHSESLFRQLTVTSPTISSPTVPTDPTATIECDSKTNNNKRKLSKDALDDENDTTTSNATKNRKLNNMECGRLTSGVSSVVLPFEIPVITVRDGPICNEPLDSLLQTQLQNVRAISHLWLLQYVDQDCPSDPKFAQAVKILIQARLDAERTQKAIAEIQMPIPRLTTGSN